MNPGFLRQFGERQAYGDGVYFAVNASYSANPSYSVPDEYGHQRMFLCRVLVGEHCRGTSSFWLDKSGAWLIKKTRHHWNEGPSSQG